MIRLILVRHAVTQWNEEKRYLGITDLPLSNRGKQQAEALAIILMKENIDLIYSSDLKRAVETANFIGRDRDTKLISDHRLRELNFGVFEGLTFSDAQDEYPEMIAAWLKDYNQPPAGGEMLSSLTSRIQSFLDDLRAIEAPKTVLVVTHGGALREIFRQFLSMPIDKHWSFQFDPASWSEIHVFEDTATVIRANQSHQMRGDS